MLIYTARRPWCVCVCVYMSGIMFNYLLFVLIPVCYTGVGQIS